MNLISNQLFAIPWYFSRSHTLAYEMDLYTQKILKLQTIVKGNTVLSLTCEIKGLQFKNIMVLHGPIGAELLFLYVVILGHLIWLMKSKNNSIWHLRFPGSGPSFHSALLLLFCFKLFQARMTCIRIKESED